jgi:hypothetical protein
MRGDDDNYHYWWRMFRPRLRLRDWWAIVVVLVIALGAALLEHLMR